MYSIFQDEEGTWWVHHTGYLVRCRSLLEAMELVDVMKYRDHAALVN